jgi:hypothetical protein
MPKGKGYKDYDSSGKKKAMPRKRTVSNAGVSARRKNRPLTPQEKLAKKKMDARAKAGKISKEYRDGKSIAQLRDMKKKRTSR